MARLVAVYARQLLQIHLWDQSAMYFGFEILKIKLFHFYVVRTINALMGPSIVIIGINQVVSFYLRVAASRRLFWPSGG